MDRATRELVAQRASDRCEYCGLRQAMSPLAKLRVEHITPRKHGGGDDPANLALACIDCNLRKGPNLTGVDPTTREITALFNPRDQAWDDHFRWDGVHIVGTTAVDRTTVRVLDLNLPERLIVRAIARA